MNEIVIGSRGSRLALWQANHVRSLLTELHRNLTVRIEVIKTSGDKLQNIALEKIGKGVFVKEIEEALLAGAIDLAVHSLKDVPTVLPEGLALNAILPREDPRDALVCREAVASLADFPASGRVGTGSLRRTVQIRHLLPTVVIEPIRGNVDTRLRKLIDQGLDAIVLALAGLNRLDLAGEATYVFPIHELTPAVGQGALAIESRTDDRLTNDLLIPLEDPTTRLCVEAERSFLAGMGGGCQVPLGAHARLLGSTAEFAAFVASPTDTRLVRTTVHGEPRELMDLAHKSVDFLMAQGAAEMLKELE